MLNAKCHAIRDAQLIEKVEIKKEQLEEEKRLDEMMEVERRKALLEYEEREKVAHFERLKGAQVLQHQITDREQARLLDDEKKDQETKVMNNLVYLMCPGVLCKTTFNGFIRRQHQVAFNADILWACHTLLSTKEGGVDCVMSPKNACIGG